MAPCEESAALPGRAQRVDGMLKGVTLTDDQKGQLDAVKKELGPKLMEVMKKQRAIWTPEQVKARGEAEKAAKAAGKTGKEFAEAVEAATKATDQQKAQTAEIRKELSALEKELREKVLAVLTPEQKEQVKKNMPQRKPAKK